MIVPISKTLKLFIGHLYNGPTFRVRFINKCNSSSTLFYIKVPSILLRPKLPEKAFVCADRKNLLASICISNRVFSRNLLRSRTYSNRDLR